MFLRALPDFIKWEKHRLGLPYLTYYKYVRRITHRIAFLSFLSIWHKIFANVCYFRSPSALAQLAAAPLQVIDEGEHYWSMSNKNLNEFFRQSKGRFNKLKIGPQKPQGQLLKTPNHLQRSWKRLLILPKLTLMCLIVIRFSNRWSRAQSLKMLRAFSEVSATFPGRLMLAMERARRSSRQPNLRYIILYSICSTYL